MTCTWFHGDNLPRGIRHHNATVTDAQGISIRIAHQGGETYESIAKRYNTSVATVCRIVRKQGRWRMDDGRCNYRGVWIVAYSTDAVRD